MSNDNPYSESLFRTVKYRPGYPNRPFTSKAEACEWVMSFVDWYNQQHRHSGHGAELCRRRALVYEKARQKHPRRWSRSTRCWRQPEVVWINKPSEETKTGLAVRLAQAA